MSVAVRELRGGEIPADLRGPDVQAVWLVVVNGEAYQYCLSEAEAWALAEALEQELEPEPPRPSFPGMR